MDCTRPLGAWHTPGGSSSPGRVSFRAVQPSIAAEGILVPCGKCDGCRLGRAREWAVRSVHEASLWQRNVFVTLTYSPEKVPRLRTGGLTLKPQDFVRFMKRLRQWASSTTASGTLSPGEVGVGPRFIQAGEYGAGGRPHHHAILFNCGFSDLKPWTVSPAGMQLYRSATLERLWPLGFSSVGEVTFESAGYVARYTLKKVPVVRGSRDGEVESGVLVPRWSRGVLQPVPEYMTMSRRPGIGAGWLAKYRSDVYPRDRVVVRGGAQMRPPRFYDERLSPEALSLVKEARRARAEELNPEEVQRVAKVNRELFRRRMDAFLKRGL